MVTMTLGQYCNSKLRQGEAQQVTGGLLYRSFSCFSAVSARWKLRVHALLEPAGWQVLPCSIMQCPHLRDEDAKSDDFSGSFKH